MNIRVAFDHQAFVMQSYGGISRYFTCLAKSLSKANTIPHIYAPLHKNNYLSDLSDDLSTGKFIKKFPPKTASAVSLFNSLKFQRFVSSFKADIVHQTYYNPNKNSKLDVPVVITVYDKIHELFTSSFPLHDNTAVIKKLAIKNADHIICISKSTQKDLIEYYGIPENKTSIVYLASDLCKETSSNTFLHPTYERPFLLFVGQRGGYKNFNNFIMAFALSTELLKNFNIICFGGGSFSQVELGLIYSLGFIPNQIIQISGDDTTLCNLYSTARAFVFPSCYEGFGLPILEAMSFGCPVLCSNTSSLPEVGGIAARYFNPNDLNEMGSVIENCVFSDFDISELREQGLKHCNKFSWDLCAKQTIEIYSACI